MLNIIKKAFEDYSKKRISVGSLIILLYFIALLFYFLWRVAKDVINAFS